MEGLKRYCALATLAAMLGLCATSSQAATTTYTDQAAFLANVGPGYYLENFDGLSSPAQDLNVSTLSFSGGTTFSYDAVATTGISDPDNFWSAVPDSLAPTDVALTTNSTTAKITITFTGDPVTAVGGNIFTTDIGGNYLTGTINIQLAGGSLVTIPNSALTTFIGFTSDVAITSLVISATQPTIGEAVWPTLDNFIVGSLFVPPPPLVPEPTSLVMAGLGVLGMGGFVRRRRRAV